MSRLLANVPPMTTLLRPDHRLAPGMPAAHPLPMGAGSDARTRASQARLSTPWAMSDAGAHSLAWPGADPVAWAGSTAEQLSLFVTEGWAQAPDEDLRRPLFDPRPFVVRRIPREGLVETLDRFFGRWHYERSRGMNGPAFGLYYLGGHAPELVGASTFARIGNPAWGQMTFRPSARDLAQVTAGMGTPDALAHRLVAESEYLELNRLALVDPAATSAPLGRGASSWFVARCLLAFEARNRRLWQTQTAIERGIPVPPADAALLAEAQLADPAKGLGFLKAVVSFSDPYEGHAGHTYMALGFHYAGTTPDTGKWEEGFPGLRSGQRLSRRTLQKARNAAERGHDTAVLRLLWEGGAGQLRVRVGDRIVHVDDGQWVRAVRATGATDPDHAHGNLDQAIRTAWRAYQRGQRERFGAEAVVETAYAGGGITPGVWFPPKRRWLLTLGAAYWQHEIERRCVYLRERLAERDAAWVLADWGPLPDTRACFYPGPVPVEQLKPALRDPATASATALTIASAADHARANAA